MRKMLLLSLCLFFSFSPLYAQSDDLQILLNDYTESDDAGIVAYISTPEGSASAAAGLADLDAGTPVQTNDLFRIGSATKPFVATIILQLAEEGAIDLDDPLSEYVTVDIANIDTATVRQALNMTSGIFDYIESDEFNTLVEVGPARAWHAADVLEYAVGQDAYFAAGDGFYYSNTNYILLQLIIEDITGNTLASELETRIFEPLGMTGCFLEDPENPGEGIVKGYGYWYSNDELTDITLINDAVGLGDGGIICNAEDLARFLPGLIEGELLEDETLADMLTAVEGEEYGPGIGVYETEYGLMVGHSGATAGFQSDMEYLVDEQIVVVVLTNNFDSEIVEDVVYDAFELALEYVE